MTTPSVDRAPRTEAGRAHHLYLHARDGYILELDDETPNSGYCPAEPDQICDYTQTILAIEAEAAQAGPPLDAQMGDLVAALAERNIYSRSDLESAFNGE